MRASGRRILLLLVGMMLAWSAVASGGPAPATQPAPRLPPLSRTLSRGGHAAILNIEGPVTDYTVVAVRDMAQQALAGGKTLLIVELDSAGGRNVAAAQIGNYLRGLGGTATTIAWVHDRATSCGILIAAGCDYIVMSPASQIGDAGAVPLDETFLPEFRDSASQNGYDFVLLMAMCQPGIELYQIRHKTRGDVRLVNGPDYQVMVQGRAMPANYTAPPTKEQRGKSFLMATDAERGMWELVRQIHDGRTTVTMDQDQAAAVGLARQVITDEAALTTEIGAASVNRYTASWLVYIGWWLSQGPVQAVLMLVFMLGLYIEMQAPGTMIAGSIAVLAMVAMLLGPQLAGLASWWHIPLFILGLVLVIFEFFVTPTFGFLGAAGIIMMFVSTILAVVPIAGGGLGLPDPDWVSKLQVSILWMFLALMMTVAGFYFLTRYFGHLPGLSRMVLRTPQPTGVDAPDSGSEAIGGGRIAVGAVGTVVTQLRPSGRAEIDGVVVDVLSPGDWIESGEAVRVIEVAGNRIVVDRTG